MLAPRPIPLQPGLPAHYGGPSGYKKLCQFLGVPTSKAQGDLATRILAEGQDHSQPADEQPDLNRHTNKKQRHKQAIEAFYGDPERRLSRWRRFVDDGLKERSGVPCFEQRALARFFEASNTRAAVRMQVGCPNTHDLGTLCAIIPRRDNAIRRPWRLPAISAWMDLWRFVRGANVPAREERSLFADAAVAVATILEDARVLQWCVDEGLMDRDDISIAPSGIEPDEWEWLGRFRKDEVRRLVSLNWESLVEATCLVSADLAALSGRTGRGSQSTEDLWQWAVLVADIAFHVEGLRLAWPDIYALQLATHPDAVAAEVESIIDTVIERHNMYWLMPYAMQVGSRWKLAYYSADGRGLDGLHVDLKRFSKGLYRAAKGLQGALKNQASLRARHIELQEREAQDPLNTDLGDQLTNVLEGLGQAQRNVQTGKHAVLAALAPEGFTFAPGEDYEKKWEELSQSAADEPDPEAGAAADAGSSPVGSPDGVPSPEEALAAEIAGLLAENNDLRSEISEHEASLRRMQEERDQALENLGAMAAYTNAPSGSVPSAEGTVPEPPLPKTVEEVWQYAGQRWRRQLAFGKDVARGVRGVAHNAGPPKKIVHHLAGLAAYCDLTVGQGSDALPLNNWLNEQNIDASPLVAGMPRPVYHDPIHDRRVEFEMHTKPNSHTSPDRCVRIYYRYDPDRNMVAVGWIGRHPS